MAQEIEIKVLDIDVKRVRKNLESLGAKFEGDNLQRIYTYDLAPISTTFISIRETIKKNIGHKETEVAKQKLASLLADLIDILSNDDRDALLKLVNAESVDEFIKSAWKEVLSSAVHDERFTKIISKYDTNPNKWIRLRESGGKITIALKQIFNRKNVGGVRQHSIDDVKEIEIEISDLERGKQLLEELGYFHKNYQEKRRISYALTNNVKVDIDFWAYIPPYLEIEAETEELVYEALFSLGFSKDAAKILNTDDVYTFYGLDMYSFKELKLD
jgi:adenylate cyclase class 2